jgi:non-homologous end joining protein Ku
MPFIQKSQILFPTLKKGFKKSDIQVFYAFKNALKNLNSYCVVKFVQRSKEHLGIIVNYKNDLMYFEMPFKRQYNDDEIDRLKEAINRETKNIEVNSFTKEAEKFVGNFKGTEDLLTTKEEKLQLLRQYIEEIQTGKTTQIKKEVKELNPFSC